MARIHMAYLCAWIYGGDTELVNDRDRNVLTIVGFTPFANRNRF